MYLIAYCHLRQEVRLFAVERIRARNVLRVGYIPDRLPFAFVNATGELVGMDVELAGRLAQEEEGALRADGAGHEIEHLGNEHVERLVPEQLDVGLLGDDLVKPTLVEVVAEDAVVEVAGLFVGDGVEVEAAVARID